MERKRILEQYSKIQNQDFIPDFIQGVADSNIRSQLMAMYAPKIPLMVRRRNYVEKIINPRFRDLARLEISKEIRSPDARMQYISTMDNHKYKAIVELLLSLPISQREDYCRKIRNLMRINLPFYQNEEFSNQKLLRVNRLNLERFSRSADGAGGGAASAVVSDGGEKEDKPKTILQKLIYDYGENWEQLLNRMEKQILRQYTCPVTHDVSSQMVMGTDGNVYDRQTYKKLKVSPLTRERLGPGISVTRKLNAMLQRFYQRLNSSTFFTPPQLPNPSPLSKPLRPKGKRKGYQHRLMNTQRQRVFMLDPSVVKEKKQIQSKQEEEQYINNKYF